MIEKDLPNQPNKPKRKVPQCCHSHFLLKVGQDAIEQIFPGFRKDMTQLGGIESNFTHDYKWFQTGRWKQRFMGAINVIQQRRSLLEWYLEKRISKNPKITCLYETYVDQLILDEKNTNVRGVITKKSTEGPNNQIQADLVIDASGFGSRFKGWIPYQKMNIKTEEISINLFYVSRTYHLKPDAPLPDWKNLVILPDLPHQPQGGRIQDLGDRNYFVTFFGYYPVQAPLTTQEYIDYARKLPVPDISEFLEKSYPTSEIFVYQIPSLIRHRVELSKKFPNRFILVGDALCRLDPIYNQGISIAAKQALILQKMLNKLPKGEKLPATFSRIYQQKIAKLVEKLWKQVTYEALRHPDSTGRRSWWLPLTHWYSRKVYQLSAKDRLLHERIAEVMNMCCSTIPLTHPKVILRVILDVCRRIFAKKQTI